MTTAEWYRRQTWLAAAEEADDRLSHAERDEPQPEQTDALDLVVVQVELCDSGRDEYRGEH